jgi:SulP family sulfate permease
MAALVAVMIMVSIGTFSWRSVTDLKPSISTSVVMLATVVVVVATHNLAFGY